MASGFGSAGAPTAFALSAGVITAFNPCGFAMLPAYVSYFVGSSSTDLKPSLAQRLVKAATVGAMVTLGFVTVFGLVGIAAGGLRSRINSIVPYVSVVVGVVLVVLGIAMLRGFEPKLAFFNISRSSKGSGLRSMYTYGVSYAIVSLSCGFAGFLTAVVSSFQSGSFFGGVRVYLAFALGMGLVLVILAFAVAFAQQAFVRGMRKVLPYVNRTSGVLLVLAGLYVTYYGYYEWKTLVRGETAPAGPVTLVSHWSGSVQTWVNGLSTGALLSSVGVVVVVVGLSVVGVRRSKVVESSAERGAES